MPELPEVETVARQLSPLIARRTIRRLEILDDKLSPKQPGRMEGKVICSIHRRGKLVVMELADGHEAKPELLCTVHLRMTGRLIWQDEQSSIDKKHLRAVLHLDHGKLLFYDIRRFGRINVCCPANLKTKGGLEPLSSTFTAKKLEELLQGSRQPLKTWLLRQDRLVGLGNIYASEILFASGLSPFRLAGSLNIDEIRLLHRSTRRILKKAISMCGTTFSDFQDARGVAGGFKKMLKVYGRTGKPCPLCKAPIQKIKQQGRSTFFCTNCQK